MRKLREALRAAPRLRRRRRTGSPDRGPAGRPRGERGALRRIQCGGEGVSRRRRGRCGGQPAAPTTAEGPASRGGLTGGDGGEIHDHCRPHDRSPGRGVPRVRSPPRPRDPASLPSRRQGGTGAGARELDLPLGHHLPGRRLGREPAGRLRTRGRRGGDRRRSRRTRKPDPPRRSGARLPPSLVRALRELRDGDPLAVHGGVLDRHRPPSPRRPRPPGARRASRRRVRRGRRRRCVAGREAAGGHRRRGRGPHLLRGPHRLRGGDQYRPGAGR